MPKKLKGRRNVYGEVSLFEAVDEYATNHNYNFSQVVTNALRQFLLQSNMDHIVLYISQAIIDETRLDAQLAGENLVKYTLRAWRTQKMIDENNRLRDEQRLAYQHYMEQKRHPRRLGQDNRRDREHMEDE
jgi:hypothetical protein